MSFILNGTNGTVQVPNSSYVDPYTGASAYVPSYGSGGGSGSGGNSAGVTGGGADPFTGGGAAAAAPRHIPAKGYLIFDQVGAGLALGEGML